MVYPYCTIVTQSLETEAPEPVPLRNMVPQHVNLTFLMQLV